jgi:hypothetical protein
MNILEALAEKEVKRTLYMRQYMNKYYETHREVILEQQVEQKKRYRANHLEKVKSSQRNWYARKKAEKEAKKGLIL